MSTVSQGTEKNCELRRKSSAHSEMTVVKRAMAMTKRESSSDSRLGIADGPFEDGYQGFR